MTTRRKFIKAAGLTGAITTLPFARVFSIGNGNKNDGFVSQPEEHETYMIGGRQAPVTIIVDKAKHGIGSSSLCYEDIYQDDMIPIHKHLNEDELIYIQRGTGIFILGEKQYEVKEGSAAFVPKGAWHGLKNTGGEPLRMMFSFTPSGFENYFREIGAPKGVEWKGITREQWDAIDKKYGIVYKR